MKHLNLIFYKYQGTGNDFIIIDNRDEIFPKHDINRIQHICDRRFGIGADGLILLENTNDVDFRMVYYNADGNESSMCGNGGRCIVAFAQFLNLITTSSTFVAIDGLHYAEIIDGTVKLQMQDVLEIKEVNGITFLDTGSPHHVELVSDVAAYDVFNEGKRIRNEVYGQAGSNVNFVEQLDDSRFKIRTYERGVENETLSCGTGATAVAIAMHHNKKTFSENVIIEVEGGRLDISFKAKDNNYVQIFLKGKAQQVYKGEITC